MYFNVISTDGMKLKSPTVLYKVDGYGNPIYYTMQKDAQKYLYKCLGIKIPTSKAVYEVDANRWKQYISDTSTQLLKNSTFNIDDEFAVAVGDHIIAITSTDISEFVDRLFAFMDLQDAENVKSIYKENVLRVNFQYKEIKIFVEMDFNSAVYKACFIGFKNGRHRVIAINEFKSFADFIHYNLQYEAGLANSLLNTASKYADENYNLSLREVLNIAKASKIVFKTDEHGFVSDLATEYRSFGELYLAEALSKINIHYKAMKKMKVTELAKIKTSLTKDDVVKDIVNNYANSNELFLLKSLSIALNADDQMILGTD